jgi:hypothetical protein
MHKAPLAAARLAALAAALSGCGSTALHTPDGGQPPDGAGPTGDAPTACTYGGVAHAAGTTFPADDGCNSCSCAANGQIACTQRACEPPLPPVPICSFEHTYTFRQDGGLRPFADSSSLMPPHRHTLTRDFYMNAPPPSCSRELSCADDDSSTVSAPDILQALQAPDVVAALAMPTPPFYGYDSRPSDGSVFIFQRDDGRGFTLGSGDAVPTGLRVLETLLASVTSDTLASPDCASLPTGR